MTASRYAVALPSYQRPDVLTQRTGALLASRHVPPEVVTVFVADDAEAEVYTAALAVAGLRYGVVVAEPTLRAARNFIARHYPPDTPVVQVDDDLDDVRGLTSPKSTAPVGNLHEFFTYAFARTLHAGLSLWGVYPTLNPFYMADTVTLDLRFCEGSLWGSTTRPDEQLHLDEKEDYERTLRRYFADGGVVRFNAVGFKNNTYRTAGGMQADGYTDRVAASRAAAKWLMETWPGYVHPNPRRKGDHAEVLLRAPAARPARRPVRAP